MDHYYGFLAIYPFVTLQKQLEKIKSKFELLDGVEWQLLSCDDNSSGRKLRSVLSKRYKVCIYLKDGTSAVSDNAFTLFYGKFRANAPRVKSLMNQIEQRVDTSPE